MSISNRHRINTFIAGVSAPIAEQRLAKIGYKGKNEFGFTSVCTSVPFVETEDITNRMEDLMPYFKEYVQSIQDKIIRSLYEGSKGTKTEIADTDIDMNAVIGYLSAEETMGRLTKMSVDKWFRNSCEGVTEALVAEKLNYPDELNHEQTITLEKHVNVYRELFSSLSGAKTVLSSSQLSSLEKIMSNCEFPEDDIISSKISSKIIAMKEKLNTIKEEFVL